MDSIVGDIVARYGEKAPVMIMSDPRLLCTFRRQFNLNTWLRDNGYLGPSGCAELLGGHGAPVDWYRTRAYGMGINGLYINQAGRERNGIVHPTKERDELLEEIKAGLLAARDPETGEPRHLRGPPQRPGLSRPADRTRAGSHRWLPAWLSFILGYDARLTEL